MHSARLTRTRLGWLGLLGLTLGLLGPGLGHSQVFRSGSTGADGVFHPVVDTTVTLPPDGIFNHTTVTIPTGVTVDFVRNAANTPVTLLATGDITIAGTIDVSGKKGVDFGGALPINPGGAGGPGGYDGGSGGAEGLQGNPGSDGLGPGGGSNGVGATYGAPPTFVSLLPLFGGSGGAGGDTLTVGAPGGSGGGGGGAIVIASSTRLVFANGVVKADGGNEGLGCTGTGSGGSGGAIRLVSKDITGNVSLFARGGFSNCVFNFAGRIRLESFTNTRTGPSTPAPSTVLTVGPVTPASDPPLVKLPTLAIMAVGGVTAPGMPLGSYTTADVVLPGGTTNPVPVTLTATNTPVGTLFTVRVIPQLADAVSTLTGPSTGTTAISTATANLTLPNGAVSMVQAFGSFTLPQVASLLPLIDGEPADRIMVAAALGHPSTITVLTKSGNEVPVDALSVKDQQLLAQALGGL